MKYAIFGAGSLGEQFLIKNWKKINIKKFFDNYKEGEIYNYLIDKPRYEPDLFVIVAVNQYFIIRRQLIDLGYSEFENFIPYQIFDKKVAIAYGNCHIHGVKRYLEQNKELAYDYGFYPFPAIQEMGQLEDYKYVLRNCELFIHQTIRKENKFGEKYSSDNMMKYLSDSCNVISIPNLYGMPICFFPQQRINNKIEMNKKSFCFYSGEDENIEKWVREGKTKDEIKSYIIEGGVYKKEEIIDMWKCFESKLLIREKVWDVKISDYIFKNYRKEKLFYEKLHITNILLKELANRLLKYMGYSENIFELPIYFNTHEMFIYYDVMEALELEFEEKYIRTSLKDDLVNKCSVDIDEYICQAYKWSSRPTIA